MFLSHKKSDDEPVLDLDLGDDESASLQRTKFPS